MAKISSEDRVRQSMIKELQTAKSEVEKAKDLVKKVRPQATSGFDDFSEGEWKQRRSTAKALSNIAEHTRPAYDALPDAGKTADFVDGSFATLVAERAHELTHVGYADDRPVLGRAQIDSKMIANGRPEDKLDRRTRPDKKELTELNENLAASLKALNALIRAAKAD